MRLLWLSLMEERAWCCKSSRDGTVTKALCLFSVSTHLFLRPTFHFPHPLLFVSVFISVCLPACLPACLSLSVCVCVFSLSLSLCVVLAVPTTFSILSVLSKFTCLSLSVCLCLCLSLCLSVCLCICLSVCVCVCVSLSLKI